MSVNVSSGNCRDGDWAWVWMCHQETAEMETGHECECVIRRLWRWRLGM